MKKYRVQVIMNDENYGLSQTVYKDEREKRFELIKNQSNSTIYQSLVIANLAIDTHKRTRQDQTVQSYNIIEI